MINTKGDVRAGCLLKFCHVADNHQCVLQFLEETKLEHEGDFAQCTPARLLPSASHSSVAQNPMEPMRAPYPFYRLIPVGMPWQNFS